MGKKGARDRGGGASRREQPQAAPADEVDLEPDDEDIAFVASHRKYAAFVGRERLRGGRGVRARASKKRKKAIAEEDKTAEFERGGARVAGAWGAAAAAAAAAVPTALCASSMRTTAPP